MKNRAFTVLELLVVISIIILLMSIATTTFFSLLDKAHGTECISNLQQIGYGLRQYSQDWAGAYPPVYTSKENGEITATWDSLLLPYVSPSNFSCKSAKTDLADYWRLLGYNPSHKLSYAYNAMLAPPEVGSRKNIPILPQMIRDPYLTVVAADAEDIPYFAWEIGSSENVYDRSNNLLSPVINFAPLISRDKYENGDQRFPLDPVKDGTRHQDGCNILLVSGNVKRINKDFFGYQNAYWEAQ